MERAIGPLVMNQNQISKAMERAIGPLVERQNQISKAMERAIGPLVERQNQISKAMEQMLTRIDFGPVTALLAKSFEALRYAIPSNFHRLEDIEVVAALTRDEGLPLIWVPRYEILRVLVEAPDAYTRRQLLVAHRDEVLDDCITVLEECTPLLKDSTSDLPTMCLEWVKESNEAARVLKAGFSGPAQSHASNVIEGIIPYMSRFTSGRRSRKETFRRAKQKFDDETSIVLLMHVLALHPLDRAYKNWKADKKQPPPDHFARHPTVHGVGHPNVFNEDNALIAVMLATSLTRQLCHETARYLPSTEAAA